MAITINRLVTGPNDVLAIEREKPWSEVFSENSIYEMIASVASEYPDAPALTCLHTGDLEEEPLRLSYSQFLARVTQTANLFNSLGVGPGDVVSFLLPNVPHAQFTLWGAATAGIVNPINFLLQPDQIAGLMNAAGSKVLVALGPGENIDIWEKVLELRDRVPSLEAIVQVGAGDKVTGALSFDTAIAAQPPDRLVNRREISRQDQSVMFHTGGTTGTPKLAPHTHENDLFCAWAMTQFFGFGPESSMFLAMPLFHAAGAIDVSLGCLCAGSELVILTPAGFRNPLVLANHWALVEKYKPTHIGGVPTHLVSLLQVPIGDLDTRSIKCAMTGGAALPREVERSWLEKFGQPVRQLYGMTEAGSVLAITANEDRPREGFVGIRLPYMEWKVVPAARPTDQTGQASADCAQGETGVVLFRGPSVFPGYLDSKQNAEILTKDGWAITGDIGFISAEGHLAITGRAKDLIMRGGHNIDPALIEESLLQHPAVAFAAAVGKPDEYAQELPVVYAELNPGEQASEGELLKFLTQNITERPALPKAVHIIETMPLTAVGKIFKPPLRWAQIEAVFRAALAPLVEAGIETEVSVSESKQHGTLAQVSYRVTDPSTGENAEARIRQVLDRFTVQYQLN